jgi:hypothetical protein
MANKTLVANPPNTNYLDGANWVGGVAPVTGDTVTIDTLPQGGPVPITITGTAITNEQITLIGTGGIGTAAGTSFDAQATLTGTTDNSNGSFDGTFTNAGLITDVNLAFTASGGASPLFQNTGTITYDRAPISNPAFSIGAGDATATLANTGTINLVNQAGGQLTGGTAYPTFVTFGSPLSGSGVVNITGDHPNATGATPYVGSQAKLTDNNGDPITGTNTFNLNDGELVLLSISTGTVNFQDATGILDFGSSVDFSNGLDINGFRAGDVIGLGTSTVTAGTLAYDAATSTLSFQDSANGNAVVSLHIIPTGTQTYTTASFIEETGVGDFTSSQSIVTTAAAPCYCPGTLILTDRGEVAVEILQIGDRLITPGGEEPIRWIGRRAYAGPFIAGRRDILPIRIRAGALGGNLPRRDLFVSPMHAMLLDGVLVPAGALVNGVSITQATEVEAVHYIHLELTRHSVIWAEGAASESFVDDNSRGMFHNAYEFAALYPGRQRIPTVYCAARVEDGDRLMAIKAEIDYRAGLAKAAKALPLRGVVDNLDGGMLCGWAQNPDSPEVPVCLEIVVDGIVIGQTLANLFRHDLRAAGIGSGRHSFKVLIPPTIDGLIEVRRAADAATVGMMEVGLAAELRAIA